MINFDKVIQCIDYAKASSTRFEWVKEGELLITLKRNLSTTKLYYKGEVNYYMLPEGEGEIINLETDTVIKAIWDKLIPTNPSINYKSEDRLEEELFCTNNLIRMMDIKNYSYRGEIATSYDFLLKKNIAYAEGMGELVDLDTDTLYSGKFSRGKFIN